MYATLAYADLEGSQKIWTSAASKLSQGMRRGILGHSNHKNFREKLATKFLNTPEVSRPNRASRAKVLGKKRFSLITTGARRPRGLKMRKETDKEIRFVSSWFLNVKCFEKVRFFAGSTERLAP